MPAQLPAHHGRGRGALHEIAEEILVYLHYAYPIFLVSFFLLAVAIRSIRTAYTDSNRSESSRPKFGPGGKPLPKRHLSRNSPSKHSLIISRPRKLLFQWLTLATTLTFAANSIIVIVHVLYRREEQWWCGQSVVIYLIGSFFVYSVIVINLIDSNSGPNTAHLATWNLAIVMEGILLVVSMIVYTDKLPQDRYEAPVSGVRKTDLTKWEIAEVAVDVVRILLLLALVGFYISFVGIRSSGKVGSDRVPDESSGLLAEDRMQHGRSNGYGSTPSGAKQQNTQEAPAGWVRPDVIPARSWWEYLKGYSVFFPYLWPSKDRKLQIMVVVCFVIVILQRVVNVLVPHQVGRITNDLSGRKGPVSMPWGGICLYILFRMLQGSQGLLGAIRSVLWVPVSQYSYRELSVASFEHVHGLSLDFHLGKRTGEVLSALGKGSSINTFLEQVTFQMVPMVVDLFVAMAYFLISFDAYYALVVAVVLFWYIYITVRMAQWRVEIRRIMVNADREQDAVKNDSMVSYETVKYFNAEDYEFNRYQDAVDKFQRAEYKVTFSLNLMNVTQNVVFVLGVMVASFIAAYQVTTNQLTVGKFVELLTYMAQLQQPLNFFGTFYRSVQSSMINAERLLELFKEQPTVVDSPTASPLPSCEGDLRFKDVHFSYDNRKPALQGLDFNCPPGTTTALVGESGGGKSTVFRLLFRFYNAQAGNILVDGYDVQDVTIDSLRRHIGVVPQDTVLFNETLMYNLKYANPQATDEDVYAACRAASIHEKIMGFPDGYNTKVGERGLRLSGGEKQRVAIARTILKNPRIILLDEATAALDTETEEHIQEALTTLAEGRTMLVIAHRLSTITRADQILVLHGGQVAESGTHEELLAKKGRYASMWKKQVRAQRAAEEARFLKDKADRLRRESKDGVNLDGSGSTSQSEDERERSGGQLDGQHDGDGSDISSDGERHGDAEEGSKQSTTRRRDVDGTSSDPQASDTAK